MKVHTADWTWAIQRRKYIVLLANRDDTTSLWGVRVAPGNRGPQRRAARPARLRPPLIQSHHEYPGLWLKLKLKGFRPASQSFFLDIQGYHWHLLNGFTLPTASFRVFASYQCPWSSPWLLSYLTRGILPQNIKFPILKSWHFYRLAVLRACPWISLS